MDRFALQDQLLGEKSQTIRKKTVSVVGLGGIGSAVAEMLARAGINLRIVDKDRVYEHDLLHLSLFSEDHLAKFKAKEAKKSLEAINKDIKVKAFHEELVENNAYLVQSDVIVDCSNSMKTTLLVDKAAKKIPLIFARAYDFEAHIYGATDTRIKQITSFLEKNARKTTTASSVAVRVAASITVAKVLKLLLKQKIEKNYLVIDTQKFVVEKKPVRKNK